MYPYYRVAYIINMTHPVPPISLPDWQVADARHARDPRAAALLEARLEVERLDARGHCKRGGG